MLIILFVTEAGLSFNFYYISFAQFCLRILTTFLDIGEQRLREELIIFPMTLTGTYLVHSFIFPNYFCHGKLPQFHFTRVLISKRFWEYINKCEWKWVVPTNILYVDWKLSFPTFPKRAESKIYTFLSYSFSLAVSRPLWTRRSHVEAVNILRYKSVRRLEWRLEWLGRPWPREQCLY